MAAVTITRELAFASGYDAGNSSMRKACRRKWNADDAAIATSTTNKLLLYVPFEKGGLGGLPLTHSMMDDLGITLEQARRAGAAIVGDNTDQEAA